MAIDFRKIMSLEYNLKKLANYDPLLWLVRDEFPDWDFTDGYSILHRVIVAATNNAWQKNNDAIYAAVALNATIHICADPKNRSTYFCMPDSEKVAKYIRSNPSAEDLKLIIPADRESYWDVGNEHQAQAVLDLATGGIYLEGDERLFREIQKELGVWFFRKNG